MRNELGTVSIFAPFCVFFSNVFGPTLSCYGHFRLALTKILRHSHHATLIENMRMILIRLLVIMVSLIILADVFGMWGDF